MVKILDVNKHEVHDRLQHVKKENDLVEVIETLIRQDPFEGRKFYLFGHMRTHEDGANKRMLWQQRLTRPKAQTNSMLYKVDPKNPEVVWTIWIIPERGQWHLYEKGSMFENEAVMESVHDFLHNREKLEAPEDDDPTDGEAQHIYLALYPNLFKND